MDTFFDANVFKIQLSSINLNIIADATRTRFKSSKQL